MIAKEQQNQNQENYKRPPVLTSETKASLHFRHTKPSFPNGQDRTLGFWF
jgi:hypothetical protein